MSTVYNPATAMDSDHEKSFRSSLSYYRPTRQPLLTCLQPGPMPANQRNVRYIYRLPGSGDINHSRIAYVDNQSLGPRI